jgi:hypothetical protein
MGARESIDEEVAAASGTVAGVAAVAAQAPAARETRDAREALQHLLAEPARSAMPEPMPSVVLGELIAIVDDGCTPLVRYAGQPGSAAVRARTVVDLHGLHVGRQVTLVFEGGDAGRPIVAGVIRRPDAWPPADELAQVEVEADGERLVIGAREQLVLRCGKASITLTKAGKVLIQGSYVCSRATGANRVKGGSVQIN